MRGRAAAARCGLWRRERGVLIERGEKVIKKHRLTRVCAPLSAADELHAARKLVNAVIHPDTGTPVVAAFTRNESHDLAHTFTHACPLAGEKVFLPLRLSFIVPCNLVLDTLMMSGAHPLFLSPTNQSMALLHEHSLEQHAQPEPTCIFYLRFTWFRVPPLRSSRHAARHRRAVAEPDIQRAVRSTPDFFLFVCFPHIFSISLPPPWGCPFPPPGTTAPTATPPTRKPPGRWFKPTAAPPPAPSPPLCS